jgi:hypothetical protein
MFSLRSTRIKAALAVLVLAIVAAGRAQINPANQILWPEITGSGAPSGSCTSANYGQPYTDTTNNQEYFCMASGWQLGSGGSGTVSGQANGVFPLGTAPTAIGAQSHMDDGVSAAGKITSTEPLVAPSVATGVPSAGVLAALPTGANGLACDESSSSGVPAAGVDYIRCDSTTHQILQSLNGAAEAPLGVGVPSISTTSPLLVNGGAGPVTGAARISCPTCGTGSSGLPYVSNYVKAIGGASSVPSITSPAITVSVGDQVAVWCQSSGSNTSITATSSPANTWTMGTLQTSSTSLNGTFGHSTISTGGSMTVTCTPNISEPFQVLIVFDLNGATGFSFDNGSGTTGGTAQVYNTYASTAATRTLQIGCEANTSGLNYFTMAMSGAPASIITNGTPGSAGVGCGVSVVTYPTTPAASLYINKSSSSANQLYGIIGFTY